MCYSTPALAIAVIASETLSLSEPGRTKASDFANKEGKEMASKIIFDTPELLDETLVSLTEACRCFPVKCSRATLERWMRRQGNRGTVLESILICGKRYTSKEAIARFIRAQLRVETERPAPTRGTMSKKEVGAAARRFGLPEPLGTRKQDIYSCSAKRQKD